MKEGEFQEIGHCGGKVTFTITKNDDGGLSYQVGFTHCSPTASALFGVVALPPGIPVGNYGFGYMSDSIPEGCFPIMIASDSQGMFGQECPRCKGYWRSKAGGTICPYCRWRGERFHFLTTSQRVYVHSYIELLQKSLNNEEDAVIDMDIVAKTAGTDVEKPPFYYSEQSQQNKYTCDACGDFNDILGKYAYCSLCGTKNDLQEMNRFFSILRNEINSSTSYEKFVKESVSAFDILGDSYIKDLIKLPMTSNRKNLLKTLNFHNLNKVQERLLTIFDINILEGVNDEDFQFVQRMFHRRHIYEHAGGQVDQEYLTNSGDVSVKLRQSLHETRETIHKLINIILKMSNNLHLGFHQILPPRSEPISWNIDRKAI